MGEGLNKQYQVTLYGGEILQIFNLLKELPYKDVVGIIGRIQSEVAAQEAEPNAEDSTYIPE